MELLDVGEHNVGCFKVGLVGRLAPDFSWFRIGWAIQDAALDVEHIRAGRIEVVVKLLGDLDARGHDKGAGGVEGEGCERDAAGLSTANREDDSDLALLLIRVPSETGERGICLLLRRAETLVANDGRLASLEGVILHWL